MLKEARETASPLAPLGPGNGAGLRDSSLILHRVKELAGRLLFAPVIKLALPVIEAHEFAVIRRGNIPHLSRGRYVPYELSVLGPSKTEPEL